MDEISDKLLELLNEMYNQTVKHIRGEEIINNIGIDEFEYKKIAQLLEDRKFVHLIKVTGSLPMIKITSNGRQFLRGEQQNNNSVSINAKNVQYFTGSNYGNASQTNNSEIRFDIQGFENIKSVIAEKNISESLKAELNQKIDELKNELQTNPPSESKITKIMENIGTTSSWLVPIITKFVGI